MLGPAVRHATSAEKFLPHASIWSDDGGRQHRLLVIGGLYGGTLPLDAYPPFRVHLGCERSTPGATAAVHVPA